MNMTSCIPEDNSHAIIVERGKRIAEYQGAEILDWFITADGMRHEYIGVCNNSPKGFIKQCFQHYLQKTGLKMAGFTEEQFLSVPRNYSLLAPGLLYESMPLTQTECD